mgnify:FL=1
MTVNNALDTSLHYRDHFPVFDSVTYINSCSQGALSYEVRAAMNHYMNGMDDRGSLWDEWVMAQEGVRSALARAFKTSTTQVALTASASAGINSLMSAMDFSGKKNRIVTTGLEFPTMGQISHAQELRGAQVVHVPSEPDNTLDLKKVDAELNDATALLAITHVCYRNGAMTDIKAAVKLAHSKGIPVLVDAYQSGGSYPINFEELGADFLVGGVLKYFLSMPGLGFLLVNINSKIIPTMTGWFAARDIFEMDIYKYEPTWDARRFEGGTPPVPSLYAAKAGVELLLKVGIDNSYNHSLNLHKYLRAGVKKLGGKLATPEHDHGAMLAVKCTDDHEMVAKLAEEKVVVSCRDNNLRISPHFYNNYEDMDRCLAAIAKNKNLLA